MSRENIEVVRAAFDAHARGEWDAVFELLDPAVVWETTGQFVGRRAYTGADGVREFLEVLGAEFDEFRAVPENFLDAGEVLVFDARSRGVGKQSRAPVEIKFTLVASVSNGRITHLRNFMERAEALEAVGLQD